MICILCDTYQNNWSLAHTEALGKPEWAAFLLHNWHRESCHLSTTREVFLAETLGRGGTKLMQPAHMKVLKFPLPPYGCFSPLGGPHCPMSRVFLSRTNFGSWTKVPENADTSKLASSALIQRCHLELG